MFSFFKNTKQDFVQEKQQEDYFINSEAQEILMDLQTRFGLDYHKQEFITLNKIESFAKMHNIHSFSQLQKSLVEDKQLLEMLINLLTVNETYFFRELAQIEYLVELMKKEAIYNILSAPCSSGEEVYTILLFLEQSQLQGKVIGIDINTEALQKAVDGVYSFRSVSKIPIEIRKKYFTVEAAKYKIIQKIKNKAQFQYKNIFDNLNDLGFFDVVFSRNMLIYFNNDDKIKALEQLSTIIRPGGYLFLGHADISGNIKGFIKVHKTLQIFQKEL